LAFPINRLIDRILYASTYIKRSQFIICPARIHPVTQKYINKLFTLAGYSAEKAVAAEKNVMNIETALAKVAFSREETRNPLKNYNKMPMTDFLKQMNGFDSDALPDFRMLGTYI